MKAKDLMSKQLFCCTSTDNVQTAAKLMKDHDVGVIAVVNNCTHRILEGVITDRDISLKVVAQGKPVTTTVGETMSKSLFASRPEDPIQACEQLMSAHQVRRIPVISKSGECLGMISQADIALHDTNSEKVSQVLAAISKPVQPRMAVAS